MSSVPEIRIVGSGTDITSTSTRSSYKIETTNLKGEVFGKNIMYTLISMIFGICLLPLSELFCDFHIPIGSQVLQYVDLVQEILLCSNMQLVVP